MRRFWTGFSVAVALTVGATTVLAGPAAAAPTAVARSQAVHIGGAVTTPTSFSAQQISALPKTTLSSRRGPVTGALLTAVLASAGPTFDSGKNGLLRASVTVTGLLGWRVTFAYGELDPGFGDHPALLTTSGQRVLLVVPGDDLPFRTVPDVRSITVTDLAATVTTPAPGAITVISGRRSVVLTAAQLARLPQDHRTVTYLAGTASQTHTESGPDLAAVLLRAGILPTPSTVVTAAGSDGYGAAVTLAESLFGGRPVLVSLGEDGTTLSQPRLIPAGDIKGGRYVSGTVTLTVVSG